jgi:hypothetical protein
MTGKVGQEDLEIMAQAEKFFRERQPIGTGPEKTMQANKGGTTF